MKYCHVTQQKEDALLIRLLHLSQPLINATKSHCLELEFITVWGCVIFSSANGMYKLVLYMFFYLFPV